MEKSVASEIYGTIAKRLGSNLKNFKNKGEELRADIGLQYHTTFCVTSDRSSVNKPFPMTVVSKIDYRFSHNIVLLDLKRRCNRRNITLTNLIGDNGVRANYGKPFIMIVKMVAPQPKEWFEDEDDMDSDVLTNEDEIKLFNQAQEKELKWINKFINPIKYSEVEQAPMSEEEKSSKREYSNTAHVPVRTIYKSTKTLVYNKESKTFNGDKKFLYFEVELMRDMDYQFNDRDRDRMQMLEFLTGMEPIIISKAKMKYFNDGGHVGFTDNLFDKVTADSKSINMLQDIQMCRDLRELTKDRMYQNVQNTFPELIPNHLTFSSRMKTFDNCPSRDLTVVEGVKSRRYVDEFRSHINKIEQKYPLLTTMQFDRYAGYKPHNSVIRELKTYIENCNKAAAERRDNAGLVRKGKKLSALVKKR